MFAVSLKVVMFTLKLILSVRRLIMYKTYLAFGLLLNRSYISGLILTQLVSYDRFFKFVVPMSES